MSGPVLPSAIIASRPDCHASVGARLHVPFGLSLADGKLYAPLEVPLGGACGCICPGCQAPLIAKHIPKGGRTPHFAHAPGSQCATGFETAVHLAAKQLITCEQTVFLPLAEASANGSDVFHRYHHRSQVLVPAGRRALTEVRLEQWCETFRPDILATPVEMETIGIEIAVTSFVGEEKLVRLEAQVRPVVEYDLRHLRVFTWETLRQALIEGKAPANWVYFPALEALSAELHLALERELQAKRKRIACQQVSWYDEEQQRSVLVEQSEKRRRAAALTRAPVFCARPWAEKARLVCQALGVSALPTLLRHHVPYEASFNPDEDPGVWQAALFGAMVQRAAARGEPQFTLEDAERWAFAHFEPLPPLRESAGLSVAAYLLELVRVGALLSEERGVYRARVASLSALETLHAYRARRALPAGLEWTSAADWPTLLEGRILAESHAATSDLPPAMFQVLTPQFADAPIRAVLDRLADPANAEVVCQFWCAVGYVRGS